MYWMTIILYAGAASASCNQKEEEAKQYLDYLDKIVCPRFYNDALATFNYYTNETDYNFKKKVEEDSKPDIYASEMKYFDWKSFNNSYLLRLANCYGLLKKNISRKIEIEFSDIRNEMITVLNVDFTMCDYKNHSKCDDSVWSDFDSSMSNQNDNLDKLNYYYLQYLSKQLGTLRPIYEPYINISNEYARAYGFANRADQMIAEFEEPPVKEFECVMLDLWKQSKHFYENYFSFIRRKYRMKFGDKFISKTGPLPASLIYAGNVDSFLPFPEKGVVSTNELFKKKNITGIAIARVAEDFYTSLGLPHLPQNFWNYSVFEKPSDRKVTYTPKTYNFYTKDDVRMSVIIDGPDNYVHEMGHSLYRVGSGDQPCCFRDAPNHGFDESVANSMTIAFSSTKFLSRIGLLNKTRGIDEEEEINNLFKRATILLPQLPSTLATELWRWNALRGNIPNNELNKVFWENRLKYEGAIATEARGEDYIDAAETGNVIFDDSIIAYYIEIFLQFQIFEATCIAAGQFDPKNPTKNPLHRCDVYGSKEAGNVMKKLYAPGASKPWTVIMKEALGHSNLSAGPFLRYFNILNEYFVKENKKNGEYIGWK